MGCRTLFLEGAQDLTPADGVRDLLFVRQAFQPF
jgi:hypothetical protein